MPPRPPLTEPRHHRRVTLADVARAAAVSSATASRALADDARISLTTRGRVRAAADGLGYVPNAAARSLRARATRTLGLLLAELDDPVHAQVAAGFEQEAGARGYTVLIITGMTEPAHERRALKVFVEHQTDGIALVSTILAPAEVMSFARPDRVVFVQADHPSLAGYRLDPPTGSIRAGEVEGIEEAVRYLVASGYREFAYLGTGATATNLTRRAAVERAMRAAGVRRPLRRFAVGARGWRSGDAIAQRIARSRPEVLICYDDKLALAVMDGLRAQGIDVPGQVAIIGFDGIPFAALSNPRLSTIASPSLEMGRRAAQMLVASIESGSLPSSIVLPVQLLIRDSSPPRRVAA